MTPSDPPTLENGAYSNNENLVAPAAVDLIRQLDAAFGEMNSSIYAGAREAEEARKNARVASELARRFSSGRSVAQANDGWKSDEIPHFTSSSPHQQRAPPPPPPHPPPYQNGGGPTFGTPLLFARETTTPSPGTAVHSKRNVKAAERLAAAHTEDLLQVSLELERTKQKLEAEQMRHDETKAALSNAKNKTAVMESQMERLLQDMETAREESGRKMDELVDDLHRAEYRIQTAEQEAGTAMDICVQADQAKEEIDRLLQRALAELNMLKEHMAQHHDADDSHRRTLVADDDDDDVSERTRRRRVHFQDDVAVTTAAAATGAPLSSSSSSSSQLGRPSRSLVAAGRLLLHRTLATAGDTAPFVSQHSTEASAARRERLRNRLLTLDVDVDVDVAAPASSDATNGTRHRRGQDSAVDVMDICRHATQVLKESGQRLNLSGRWFNGETAAGAVGDEIYLEMLAKHYTTLVEVRLQKIVVGYLFKKLLRRSITFTNTSAPPHSMY